jgi:hypothetical protein
LKKNAVKLIGKGALKYVSHTWSATSKWMNQRGYIGVKHHWAISQKTGKKFGLESIVNQPWNIKLFRDQASHMRLGHGQTYKGVQGTNIFGQFWYGTPIWFKAGILGTGGEDEESLLLAQEQDL